MFTGNIKRSLFIASLAGVAISLPLSEWLLSVFIIITIVVWIADGGIKKIPWLPGDKKIILLFLAGYIVYMVWMINTSEFSSGLNELKLKLPLLIFPLVTGLSEPLHKREIKAIIASFITGVVISSVAGVIAGFQQLFSGYPDPRILSPFISHIRLALMALFAISCSGWYFFFCRSERWHDWLFPVAAVWLIIYLYLLLSLTGVILFLAILFISMVAIAVRIGSKLIMSFIAVVMLIIIFSSVFLIIREVKSFYAPGNAYVLPPKEHTAGGRPYFHDLTRNDIENGNKVWMYICEEELSNEWNSQSSLPYDSADKKGQILRYTLIRYLTSAGYTKDSSGISNMAKSDILNVENGITNKYFSVWNPWRSKMYEVIWQIDYYRNGGNPSGHSITQRIEFFKTGIEIFKRYPLFGTGTGDLVAEYHKQYNTDRSLLDEPHRLLSHNQFLSFLVSFGITGFSIMVFSLFYPFIMMKGFRRYLPSIFMVLLVLSMLWEDTLETHTGVSFFAYFYSVFIFGSEYNESDNKKQ
jgi:O-antigen ligase